MKLETLEQQVEDFLVNTEDPRFLSEKCRDYKNNVQWTTEERSKLEKRGQACITVNRIKPKVEGLKGLLIQKKTDPKAFPRTQKHEKAAEAITDALRYVSDNNKFDKIKLEVADNVFVEGYGAVLIDHVVRRDEVEIRFTAIPWDRYYYDINSRRLDFSDKLWDGIVIWMNADIAKDTFNLTDDEIEEMLAVSEGSGFETFDDKPQWVDRKGKRVRVCQHFYFEKGQWYTCFFTKGKFLIEPELSPYVNEYGEPINPIESIAANVDRDNNRFGEVTYWLDLQDEINHRRSKYLFLLSARQTMSRKGAITDIPALKRELAKPDGHVEYEGDKGDFDMLPTNDMAQAQYNLLQEGKQELDAVGFNAQLSGERQGDLSGKAILNLQQAATNELSSLYENLLDWENRVYRQSWYRIKQFWNEEKWLRVLDDKTKLRWVGLNQRITLEDSLREMSRDESLDIQERIIAEQQLIEMKQTQDPRLASLIEVRNPVAELDVDILIESSYDLVNIQREQFELLGKIAQTRPDVPFTEVLKLSELRGKDKIIKNIEESSQAAQQAQQVAQQIAQAKEQADMQETQSKTVLNQAKAKKEAGQAQKQMVEAEQTVIQTELLLETPPDDTGVVI